MTDSQPTTPKELTEQQALTLPAGTQLVVIDDRPGSYSDPIHAGDVVTVEAVANSYEPNIQLKHHKGYYHHSRFALVTTPNTESESIRAVLKRLNRDAVVRGREGKSVFSTPLDEYEHEIEALLQEIHKAYGGCKNCYGKGYATVNDRWHGHDTDTDIGSPGGYVSGGNSNAMKFCACERGKQLEVQVTGARLDEATKAAFLYARSHGDDFLARQEERVKELRKLTGDHNDQ